MFSEIKTILILIGTLISATMLGLRRYMNPYTVADWKRHNEALNDANDNNNFTEDCADSRKNGLIFSISTVLIIVSLICVLPCSINAQTLHDKTLEVLVKQKISQNTSQVSVGESPKFIAIGPKNTVYVVNTDSDTVSVISISNNTKVNDIPVGDSPKYIAVDFQTIYVSNTRDNTISAINGATYRVENITVGDSPNYIVVDPTSDTIYVDHGSKSVSAINGTTHQIITQNIPVGDSPRKIVVDNSRLHNSDAIYVADFGSNTVSAINGTSHRVENIPVGKSPEYLAVDRNSDTIYVSNTRSNSISVIDGKSNDVVAGVTFKIVPANSGHVVCNKINPPTNQYFYLASGTRCTALTSNGFEFNSWIENLKNNFSRTLNNTVLLDSPLISFLDSLGFKSNDPSATFDVNRFGTFTANFKTVPPPVPPEYWIPLYGIIVSTIVGWSIPSIIGWISTKRRGSRVSRYEKQINTSDSTNLDIGIVDGLKTDVTNDFLKAHSGLAST
jgi:YVTN family beta-propeller protein